MYRLTDIDHEVMNRAQQLETGGMAAFTAHYFSPIEGAPRPDLIATAPDKWDLDRDKHEYVPWVPLPWQLAIAHDDRLDSTIIGGLGSGKTVGVGAAFCYWSCVAPLSRVYDAGQAKYITAEGLWKSGHCPWVLSWTGKQFVIVKASPVALVGQADHIKVTLSDGRQITVAPNHRFLTPEGWQCLSSLRIGDQIAVFAQAASRSSYW